MLDNRPKLIKNLAKFVSRTKTMARTWIKVSTAAKLKGVRRQTIYYHIDEGNLISMDMDGVTFVDKEEVLNLKPKGKGEYRKRKPKDTSTKKAKTEFVPGPRDLGLKLALP